MPFDNQRVAVLVHEPIDIKTRGNRNDTGSHISYCRGQLPRFTLPIKIRHACFSTFRYRYLDGPSFTSAWSTGCWEGKLASMEALD
ncbi:hypothetical protein R70006_06318 [Paraburkholderia domus]|nr:hypothetical protein R70006_06318 [Paraburkholderia domus]